MTRAKDIDYDKYDATTKLEEIVYRGKTFTLS